MCGLWLAGACAAGLAGCKIEGLTTLADNLVLELQKNYVIVSPGSPMNGSWSPAVREGTDNGMFLVSGQVRLCVDWDYTQCTA